MENQTILKFNIINSEIIIPKHSNSPDYLKVFFEHAEIIKGFSLILSNKFQIYIYNIYMKLNINVYNILNIDKILVTFLLK